MSFDGKKVAIVHDELTRRGGAEVLLEEILRIFPQADLFALYAGQPLIEIDGQSKMIKTSWLQKLPSTLKTHPSHILPLLPLAAEQLDLAAYDIVISSSSGFAKNIVTRANVVHICYCHTPTRYLWDNSLEALRRVPKWRRLPAKILLHLLRLSDFAGAQRVDHFIANSKWTQQRIKNYYRADSEVIYPPINTSFYTPSVSGQMSVVSGGYFLCVGRLTPSKKFDQAIVACEKLGLPLQIIGVGRDLARLKKLAGKNTKFIGRVDNATLREYYRQARALLQPGEEDFGMAAAEALACGTPVIASAMGGAPEIIKQKETGLLYGPARVESLAEAIREFITNLEPNLKKEIMQQSVLRFSKQAFKVNLKNTVDRLAANE